MILVTGASGSIGARLVRSLLGRGHRVRALVVPDDPTVQRLGGLDCERVIGDITQAETLTPAMAGVHTVFHLAALLLCRDEDLLWRVNVDGTANVLAAAGRAGVSHLVQVSSASVIYPESTPYSRSKREGERLVRLQDKVAWTIVRPTLVYDRDEGLEFQLFLEQMLRLPIVPFVGNGSAVKRPVYVDDLVLGLAALAGRGALAHGKVYNLSGSEAITLRQMARILLQRHGLGHRPILPVPVALCSLLADGLRLLGMNSRLTASAIAGLVQDADLDPAEACRDLEFRPRGFREGIAQCFPLTLASDRHRAAEGRS